MAVPLAKEVLRALQDVLSVHKTLLPAHAQEASNQRLYTESDYACRLACARVASRSVGWIGLAAVSSMAHEIFMADHVLVW